MKRTVYPNQTTPPDLQRRNASMLSAYIAGESLAAIGRAHGNLSRERVRQIVARAIRNRDR